MMSLVPEIAPGVSVAILADDLLVVVENEDARPLTGRLFPLILPLVDGRRSVAEIADALDGRATIADVAVGVEELVEERALAAAGSDPRRTIWIEPIFGGGPSDPCRRCLQLRLDEMFAVTRYLAQHYPDRALIRSPRRPAAAPHVPGRAGNVLYTLDTGTGVFTPHRVVRRPDCPDCGGSTTVVEEPQPLDRHVDPITGVVHSLRLWSRDDVPAHMVVAEHVFPPEIEFVESIWRRCRRRTAAGGATLEQARAGAIGEAIERYSGVYRRTDRGRRATYTVLDETAIHPNRVMGFSAGQLRDRVRWNRRHPSRFARVAEPFCEQTEYAWTRLRPLDGGAERWLPTACCYYGAEPESERRSCFGGSNGCAAGTTFEDAIVRGFLEAVERDAVGIWWHNRIERRGVDLATVPDEFVRSVAAAYERFGRTLCVLNVTTDLGVPCFAAVSRDSATGALTTLGFGAHFDAREALRHALREINLFLPELLENRRRSLFDGEPSGAYLEPTDRAPWSASDWPSYATDPLTQVRRTAAAHGLEVLVLDQTRSDLGVPVARVVVPDLCHFWPRYGHARLSSVPIVMGWRRAITAETDLNPALILL
ncbi:MAG TPA: YcaO-like family protein [Vicinamibacterales bacterium]|nr:YcaO-like family protein [Vicinamibacterales bacterium]